MSQLYLNNYKKYCKILNRFKLLETELKLFFKCTVTIIPKVKMHLIEKHFVSVR
jgi:hypothetical protein